MSKSKPFYDLGLNPITMWKEDDIWNYAEQRKQKNESAKLKRKEMRNQVELETGIKTRQNKKSNGVIEILVQNDDYDTMYDQVTLETECANNTGLLLNNLFKQ